MAPQGQFWVFEGPRPFGDGLKVIWSKKSFFRENRIFWAPNGPKYTQNGPKGGRWRAPEGQFWVFEAPRPSGGSYIVILDKKFFFDFFAPGGRKMAKSFWAQTGQNRAKQAKTGQTGPKCTQNGPHGVSEWPQRANIGFLTVPDPSGWFKSDLE